MTADEFRALLTRHGGLIGTEIVDKSKEEEIAGHKTGELIPPTTVRIKYTTPNGEVTARQRDDGSFEVLDDPKGLVKAAGADAGTPTVTQAETARHNKATEAQAANTASRADRREQQQLTAAEAQQRATALREERANAVATGRLTLDQANAEYDRRYKEEVETPLKRSAEQRAVEAAKRAEDQARFEREKFRQEQVSSREKETTRRQEAEAKFSYDAGQDAVSQAMKLLPYRVGPTFGAEFSQALNTLGNGGGAVNFTPGAVTFDAPDYASIAEQAAQRAHALFNLPAPAAPGMPAAPAAPAPVAAPGVPVAPVAPPTGLPVTPANRDVYAR